MKKFISMLLVLITLLSCISMAGCSSKKKSSNGWSYYTRSDGKRIWVKR